MKKTKIEKGDYGYIDKSKIRQLIITLLLLVIVVVIFYTGIIRYGHTKSIFTVLAAVSAIPAAKYAVAYIVMLPYRTGSKMNYDKLVNYHNITVLSDLLISSTEKVINIVFAVVRDNSVFCYIPNDKYDRVKVEKYLKSFLGKECKISAVKAFKDFESFEKSAKTLDGNEEGRFDKRISELLKIFSM